MINFDRKISVGKSSIVSNSERLLQKPGTFSKDLIQRDGETWWFEVLLRRTKEVSIIEYQNNRRIVENGTKRRYRVSDL